MIDFIKIPFNCWLFQRLVYLHVSTAYKPEIYIPTLPRQLSSCFWDFHTNWL